MPLRVLLRDRVAQPTGLVGINLAHPLARGLVGAWLPAGTRLVDVIGGLNTTPTASVTASANAQIGRVAANTSTTNNAGAAPASSRVEPSTQMTAILFGRRGATGTQVGTEVSSNGWGFGYSSGNFPGRVYLRVGAAFADQDCGVASGETAIWGFTFNGATFRAYKNGRQTASQAISGTITHSGAGIVFSGNPSSLSNSSANQIGGFWVWNRALSDAEVAAIASNPWQLFEPQPAARGVAAALGGAAALQGDATSLATAGGSLSTSIQLTGTAAAVALASGALVTGIRLAGGAGVVASATGSLSASTQLVGSAVAGASASGALSTSIRLTVASGAVAGSSGLLTTSIRLVGAAVAVSTAAGALGGGSLLTANSSSAAAIATATGNLTTGILLAGSAGAVAAGGATLSTAIRLTATVTAISTASGILTVGPGSVEPGAITPDLRRLVVMAEQRRQIVQAESRRLAVPQTVRRLIIESETA